MKAQLWLQLGDHIIVPGTDAPLLRDQVNVESYVGLMELVDGEVVMTTPALELEGRERKLSFDYRATFDERSQPDRGATLRAFEGRTLVETYKVN